MDLPFVDGGGLNGVQPIQKSGENNSLHAYTVELRYRASLRYIRGTLYPIPSTAIGQQMEQFITVRYSRVYVIPDPVISKFYCISIKAKSCLRESRVCAEFLLSS